MHGQEGRQSAPANEGDPDQRNRYVFIAALVSFMPTACFVFVSIASVRDRLIRVIFFGQFRAPGRMALASDVAGMYHGPAGLPKTSARFGRGIHVSDSLNSSISLFVVMSISDIVASWHCPTNAYALR
jgi:hypothetical protein